MILTESDLELIEFDQFTFVKQLNLSIGSYYVKFCCVSEAFRELLGQKVFEMVGIRCAKYDYIPLKKCVLSKDLNVGRKLKTLHELKIKGRTLHTIYEGIENFFSNSKQLKLSIEIMHFIDLLFSNIDRHTSNFVLDINHNCAELVVYDNACFLDYYKVATRPVAAEEYEDFFLYSKKEEAIEFVNNMSNAMKILAPKYLELFSPEKVELMINNIENDINMQFPDKRYHMKKYRKNYNMVFNLIKIKNFSFKLGK